MREHPKIADLKQALAEGRLHRREFLRFATLLGMSATAAYAFAGKVTGQGFAPRARAANMPRGGTLKIAHRVQEMEDIHAYNWSQPASISLNILSTLAVTHQDNVTRPGLAERWEASDDLRSWTFHLRQDLKWHNGRAFTADDVLANFQHILDPATGSSSIGLMKAYMLEEFETGETDDKGNPKKSTRIWDANAIEKAGDRAVRFNLKVPQVALPEHLFHYTNQQGDPEEGFKLTPGANGTGAFELVDIKIGEKAVLRARKEGWYGEGPYVDTIEFIDLGDDQSANVSALLSKQVHGLHGADLSQLPILEKIPHINVHQAHTANTAVVQLRVDKEPFTDARVRQAMRHGIDSARVVQLSVQGKGLPGEHHFVAPIHPEYSELPNMYDPAKARALLAEAGYPDGIDVEFVCKQAPPWEVAAVQVMAEQYKEAGIRCNINVMPSAQFWDIWDKPPLAFVSWGHRPLGIQVLALGFRSGVPWNAPQWSNKEFDDLLTEAEGTLDIDKRREVMRRVQLIMQEDGPIGQPVWLDLITGFDKKVKGFKMHPAQFIFGNEIAIES